MASRPLERRFRSAWDREGEAGLGGPCEGWKGHGAGTACRSSPRPTLGGLWRLDDRLQAAGSELDRQEAVVEGVPLDDVCEASAPAGATRPTPPETRPADGPDGVLALSRIRVRPTASIVARRASGVQGEPSISCRRGPAGRGRAPRRARSALSRRAGGRSRCASIRLRYALPGYQVGVERRSSRGTSTRPRCVTNGSIEDPSSLGLAEQLAQRRQVARHARAGPWRG